MVIIEPVASALLRTSLARWRPTSAMGLPLGKAEQSLDGEESHDAGCTKRGAATGH